MSESWEPIESKPAWATCEERGIYSHDGDGLFYFRATHWRPVRIEQPRFINCEVCQTEGRILTNDGGPDDVDHGVCPECNGERVVEVKTEPCGPINKCPSCKRMFVDGETCSRGGCPMGGDV